MAFHNEKNKGSVPKYWAELDRKIPKIDIRVARELLDIINKPDFIKEIDEGKISLAMIRPNVGPDANILKLSDEEAAEEIESMIQGLGYMTKFSLLLDKNFVEEFYGGKPHESMVVEQPQDPKSGYSSRWPEFIDFMCSGPTTFIILYDLECKAIEKWRKHLGHWNINEHRDVHTIRGKLGVNKYNNLVHGSDSPESVKRELRVISTLLMRVTK